MEKEAMLYDKTAEGKVRCRLCPHSCAIIDKARGACGVRENRKGKLISLVYSRPVSVNLDPIEKKPLYHFMPGSKILSIGTLGCNLSCEFCQNWEISQSSKNEGASFDYPEAKPEQIVECAIEAGSPSIAYTYNEPTVFIEYALDVMKLAKKKGLKNVWVSNGFISEEALRLVAPYLDAINIDLKSFSEDFYRKTCKARLQPVLDTIKRVKELGIWQEITTLLIPGQNDSDTELKKIAEFIAGIDKDIPWHISAFHPDYRMTGVQRTPLKSLERAYEIGKKAGLRFIYVGNVADSARSNTQCPGCSSMLIARSAMSTIFINMEKGKCNNCREHIPGVW